VRRVALPSRNETCMMPTLVGGRTCFAAALLSVAAAMGIAMPAAASPIEVFGFGARHAARAGAGTAVADDFAALHYNPAGLALGHGARLTLGGQGAVSNLSIDDRRQSFADAAGVVAGVTLPAPLGGPLADRAYLGLGLYLLPRTIAQIRARSPDEPFYPWYDNRLQRVVVLSGLGVRITDDVTIGVAVNFLAGMTGGIQAREGATRALEARVDEKVPAVARINAGATWQVLPVLRLGLSFRERFEVPFATAAEVEVAGEPIDLDLSASGQFTPTQVSAGVAWEPGPAMATVDVTWANWSAYPGPFVTVRSALPLVGPLAAELPVVPYKDTVSVRVAGETTGRFVARAGYGFETSPIPGQQTGVTNLLDGPKHTVGVGAGVRFPDALAGKDVRIDAFLQAQIVGNRSMDKQIWDGQGEYDPFTRLRDEVIDDPTAPATAGAQISNPGYPGIESGGQVFAGGLTVEVEL
jgi:hypothetical protein